MQPGDSAMGVPHKSMVETEILKFGEAEEKIEKMNRELGRCYLEFKEFK